MSASNDNDFLSSWRNDVNNSKTRASSFDTLSGHHLDVCYFPENIDQEYLTKSGVPRSIPIHSRNPSQLV